MSSLWLKRSRQGRSLLKHRSEVLSLISKFGGNSVMVFGSVARGDSDTDSDIDLLIEMDDRVMDQDAIHKLCTILEDLLGYPVDIANPRYMAQSILNQALREARSL